MPFGRYYEPFIGGGALFFELARLGRLQRPAFLSDGNPNLIAVYRGVRDSVNEVIAALEAHAAEHSEAHFYAVRAAVPASVPEQAARIIYLNRTCFNGLYRENSRGLFNVPFGRYANPTICDETNLRACSQALQAAEIATGSFETILERAVSGDFVYCDPPYQPVSKTASFSQYSRGGFGEAAQVLLAETYDRLTERGVKVLLSNSSTELIHGLYWRHHIAIVRVPRYVNSRADGRGAVDEVLVSNFQ